MTPHGPGHVRLLRQNAEEGRALPRVGRHCIHGHDALLLVLLQPCKVPYYTEHGNTQRCDGRATTASIVNAKYNTSRHKVFL